MNFRQMFPVISLCWRQPQFMTLRNISTSATLRNRAIVFSQTGDPKIVLNALTYPPLPSPTSNTINVKLLISPVNPSDVNVVEGVYPTKPSQTVLTASGIGSKDCPVFIGGNEGLAQITEVGSGVSGFEKGDWVIMIKPQSGTWCSGKNVNANDVLKLPRERLSEVHGATMTVNPPTAYNMLSEFVKLNKGDWVIQNGANSAVC
jgi:NADPH:quinone reductase-like Zn-dependent oxidoreductase